MNKIASIYDLKRNILPNWHLEKEPIVFCHGHFNVIHPGHLRFLQHAKSLGAKLVVAVYDDAYFSERNRSKYYDQQIRMESVSFVESVNIIIPQTGFTFAELIKFIKPSVYILGKEFEKERKIEVESAISVCKQLDCKVVFHSGDVQYANIDLFNNDQSQVKLKRIEQFHQACKRQKIDIKNLLETIKNFKNSKVLVIGDTIIDQYVACEALGMSSEAPVLVARELESKEFIGGAAIIAAHIKALGAQCHYLSIVGDDKPSKYLASELKNLGVQAILLKDKNRPTTFKIRYMVENQKLFRVSRLKEQSIEKELEEQIIKKLDTIIPKVDAVLVSDFVYGVITKKILTHLTEVAKNNNVLLLGDLQCSSQVGKVTKFKDFNLLTPTEKEARIALDNQQDSLEWVANTMIKQTNAASLLLKLGGNGFIAYQRENADYIRREHFPALETNPLDVTGAGDSLIALMSVCMSIGVSVIEASALGTVMAALAVQNIGNIPIKVEQVRNYLHQLRKVESKKERNASIEKILSPTIATQF